MKLATRILLTLGILIITVDLLKVGTWALNQSSDALVLFGGLGTVALLI